MRIKYKFLQFLVIAFLYIHKADAQSAFISGTVFEDWGYGGGVEVTNSL